MFSFLYYMPVIRVRYRGDQAVVRMFTPFGADSLVGSVPTYSDIALQVSRI